MNSMILIFILLFYGIRATALCPTVADGTCTACSGGVCNAITCNDNWSDMDGIAANGCEHSSIQKNYCDNIHGQTLSNCDISYVNFSVTFSNSIGNYCYCTSVNTIERYIVSKNDKCVDGLPQYRNTDGAPTITNGACEQYNSNTCLFANCIVGYHNSAGSCAACGTGQYQSQTNQTDCDDADAGHYAAGSAQTAQTECVAGTYQSQQGQVSCVDASTGHYAAGSAQTAQTACVAGTYQSQQGQVSCVDASTGHYASGTAQPGQTACAAGTFQPQGKQTSCQTCDKGYCPEGATVRLLCGAGNEIDYGRTSCTPCAAGTFQDRSNQMSCKVCATKKIRGVMVGEYQDETGQTACKACIGSVVDFTSCAAKCKVGDRQHICPVLVEAIKYRDNLNTITCATSQCQDNECCEVLTTNSDEQINRNAKTDKDRTDMAARMTTLFTDVVSARDTIDTAMNKNVANAASKKTELQDEMKIENGAETMGQAITRVLAGMATAVSTKMNEKLEKSFTESDEEIEQTRVKLKKESREEQMQKLRDNVIDLSALKFEAAKNAVKETIKEAEQEERDANDDTSTGFETRRTNAANAKVVAKAARKQLAVASRNIKAILKANMKTAKDSVAAASEDDLAIVVATKDVAVLNDELNTAIKKRGIEYMKLKLAKDHSAIGDAYNWDDFNCEDADLNLDEMGLYDLDEVMFDKDEKAVACNLGDPVTYVEKKTDKTDDYNDYDVYCCGESSGVRLRRLTALVCTQKNKDENNQTVKWNEHDTYTCPATGDYQHPVMSLGGTFTGCILESNGTVGWVYDSPGRTLGDCSASQCTVNNTNVTCLYLDEACQPACEAGYASNGLPLTCSGGDNSSGTTCTECSAGTYSTVTGCVACPTGKYVAATGQLTCHDVTDIATELLNATGVQCSFGGTVQYGGNGAYSGGCKQQDGQTDVKIVMYGVVRVKNAANTCENQCAKWYGTLENGFKDPRDDDSNVAIYGGLYCQYLLWTSVPIKSDEC